MCTPFSVLQRTIYGKCSASDQEESICTCSAIFQQARLRTRNSVVGHGCEIRPKSTQANERIFTVHTNARGEFVKADALDRTESVVGMLILANLPHKLCYYKIRPIFVCNRSLSHITSPSCLTIDSQSSSDSSSRKYELPKSIITARHTAPSCPTTKR
jgi:hypothetical protein